MNLIDRYVTAVGKHLPRKNRLDIEAELRSTLEDMLEDRSQQTNRPADETLSAEILQEFGAPRQVAETYQTHPYLIGKRMFPVYVMVLKIVFFAVTLGLSIATIISMVNPTMASPDFLNVLGKFTASLVNALVIAFGNVTIIFAILERTLPVSEFEATHAWTPADLTKDPDPNHVKIGEIITSLVFTLVGLIVLNFYPNILGVWNLEQGEWRQIVTLSNAFFRYLPWINLAGILTITLNIFLLRKGIWGEITRWAQLGIKIISLGIAVALLRGADLLFVSSQANSLKVGFPLGSMFDGMIAIALIVVIVVNIIDIAKNLRSIVRHNKSVFPLGTGS